MKKIILSLLVALMTTTGAWADYGWYSGSMTIGGVTTDCTAWSTDDNNPTDLGFVTDMTVTSVAFNVWSDANDRGGANMFFRIWDGGSSQVGSDQDLWLGSSNRIAGDHDFAISWTGTLDLASAVGLTLEHGKTYYIDMYAKTYGNSGDEWYSGGGANFHAKLTCVGPTTSGIVWNTSTNSGTFLMPAYDVEVTTELWYRLSQTEDNTAYQTKTNVFLERTLQAGGWNTFCAPFAISNPASVFGEGVQVKAFSGSSLSGGTLTLSFSDAATIAAATPYLIKLPGASNVDLTADGKEFEGVTQNWTPVDVNPDEGVATFKAALAPVPMTADDKTILFVSGGDKLTFPNTNNSLKAFRAYFQLLGDAASIKAFNMSFEDDADGIGTIQNSNFKIQNGEDAWYDLSGRKMVNGKSSNGKLPKGIYIHNGRKEVMK